MDPLLIAQQVATGPDLAGLAVSLGTGAVAVLFAMKWAQSETEKRNTMAAEHAREKQAWVDYLKGKRDEDAEMLRLVLQKGKASS